jgi:beta-1,4-mannosyltransferase
MRAARRRRLARECIVLMSPGGDASGNPYNTLLVSALSDAGVSVLPFRWKVAFFGRYAVLHVHWPEALVHGRSAARSWLKLIAFLIVILRCHVCGTPIVWTVHNVRAHDAETRPKQWAIMAARRWSAGVIHLSAASRQAIGEGVVIPHGPYPSQAAHGHPGSSGYVLFFGLLRPYKGVYELLSAYAETSRSFRLVVRGPAWPSEARYAQEVIRRARIAEGVDATVGRLSESELDESLAGCAGVVLPYAEMGNSGAVFKALSAGRPVLVPDTPVTAELAAEFGTDWVQRYEGSLTAEDLDRFWHHVRSSSPDEKPSFDGRGWDRIGQAHLEVYRSLIRTGRRRLDVGSRNG